VARKKSAHALVTAHRGIEDGTSVRFFVQRGRPVPRVESQSATVIYRNWLGRESDGGIVPLIPSNIGGGKDPNFWHAFEGDEVR